MGLILRFNRFPAFKLNPVLSGLIMLHVLNYTEYSSIDTVILPNNAKITREYNKTVDAIATHWLGKLGSNRVCTLLFLLNRTLKYGKVASKVPFPAFLGGVTSERTQRTICSPLDMSKNTVRATLKYLAENDFIHVYFPEKVKGIMDTATRYYEVNFKKLQMLGRTAKRSFGELMSILRTPKVKKVVDNRAEISDGFDEIRVGVPKKRALSSTFAAPRPSLPKFGDLSSGIHHTKVCNRFSKENHVVELSSDDAVSEVIDARSVVRVRRTRRNVPVADLKSIAKPAPIESIEPTPQPTRETAAQISARIEQMLAASKARKADKASKARTVSPLNLKQNQIQDMCDQAMQKYHPNLPRMYVTGKAFGAMRRHLKNLDVPNFADFLDWTIRTWEQTAHKRNIANQIALKKEGTVAKYAPLPAAPDFNTFGFRLPLFVGRFASHLVERNSGVSIEQQQKEKIKQLSTALQNSITEQNQLRKAARDVKVSQRKARGYDVGITTQYDDLGQYDDDAPLPMWK